MPFQGLKLTKFGETILNKASAGKGLHLTRVALGDGEPGDIQAMSGITSEKMSVLISGVLADQGGSVIIFRLTNQALEQGFYYREIGVYARDPDTGEAGVYLYGHSRDGGLYIGNKDDLNNRIDRVTRIRVRFSQTSQISFDPGGDPLYVLYQEYEERVTKIETARAAAMIVQADHEDRIKALEDSLTNNITGNPWNVRFDDLVGINMTGVWNETNHRIEC